MNGKTKLAALLFSAYFVLCMFTISHAADTRRLSRVDEMSHEAGGLGKYSALIIGINDYQDAGIPRLATAVADAESIAAILRQRYGFSDITLLKNGQATKKSIDSAFRKKIDSCGPEDSLLIYFAGHGDIDRQLGDGWWVPNDAKGGDSTTYIDNVVVQKYLAAMKARHVLLVSDSCYSGTLFGEVRALPPVINDKFYLELFNEKSRWGMTSGNKTPVSDRGSANHSIFAASLLRKLEKNQSPYLTPREIYADIGPVVRNNSEQMPVCRPIKNTGDAGGEFVFVLAKSGGLTVSDGTAEPGGKTGLRVDSVPGGCKVMIDGKDKGTAPAELTNIASGAHTVKVSKQGYANYEETVRVTTGRTMEVRAVLEKQATTGSVKVTGSPAGAKVYIDNAYSGTLPCTIAEIDPGSHSIKAVKEGYEDFTETVRVTAGKEAALKLAMKKAAAEYTETSFGSTDTNTGSSDSKSFTNSIGQKFVYIGPGSFMMGSPSSEEGRYDDEVQHKVTLSRCYYMQATEVTQGQWKKVMGDNPSSFSSCGDDCPVESVSWDDVQEFISKLNSNEGTNKYYLPTEAEWEYAARAGSTTAFANGGITELECGQDRNLGNMGWYCGNANSKTHAVGQKQVNRWGLYDMHGNVWEWCSDWYGDYPSGSVTDPKGVSSGFYRVFRGGSWTGNAWRCRSANRYSFTPDNRINYLGFRLSSRSSGQ